MCIFIHRPWLVRDAICVRVKWCPIMWDHLLWEHYSIMSNSWINLFAFELLTQVLIHKLRGKCFCVSSCKRLLCSAACSDELQRKSKMHVFLLLPFIRFNVNVALWFYPIMVNTLQPLIMLNIVCGFEQCLFLGVWPQIMSANMARRFAQF